MAKNKTSRSRRSGHPAKRATVSLSAHRTKNAMASLTQAFVEWFAEGYGQPEEATKCLDAVTALAATYSEIAGTFEVTAFEPAKLVQLIEVFEAADPELATASFEAFHLYVDFLRETGNWTGSEEDFDACHGLLIDEEVDAANGVITVPDIPEAEEAGFLSSLPLVQRAAALLDWIGGGRPVTATGALRLKDIEAAAARVGVAARGSGGKSSGETETLPGLGNVGLGHGAGTLVVRSMNEVPLLAAMWRTLQAAGMIRVSTSRAVPSEAAVLRGAERAALAGYRRFVGGFLWQALFETDSAGLWAELPLLQAAALAAACTDDPPPIGELLSQAGNLHGLIADLQLQHEAPNEDPGEEAEKTMALLLGQLAFGAFQDLAELGLVELDSHLRVPPQLVRTVAEVLQDEFDVDIEYPAGEARVAPSAYQLKVQLKRSKPPIWRRVEVPSDLRLDQLHEVIQVLFGWLDWHLHAFQVGGRNGQLYCPPDEDLALDDGIDESTVRLSEVLTSAGDKFDYTYDFGDDWEHAITLEKVLATDPEDAPRLPRCTGGRGASPLEDSGGVWGWMEMVEEAGDPEHPDHEDVRAQLSLSPGQRIDAKAFDPEAVNGLLGRWGQNV